MTDQVSMEKFVSLQKKLATNELAGYEFEAELCKGVVDIVVALDEAEAETLYKAFDALVAAKEEAVTKAVEVEVAKAAEKKEEEMTDLQKSLTEEAGEAGEPEVIEKSEAEIKKEKQKARQEEILKAKGVNV
jgi:chemotaxis protein histidine kinase CheA